MDESNHQQEPAPSFETPEKKKLSLRNKLLLAGAGIVLVAVVATGTGLAVSANGQKSPEATSSSAPANPSESPAPQPSNTVEVQPGASIEQLIAQNEIKADQDPQALSQNVLSEFSAWQMAGSDTVVKDFLDQVRKTADGSDEAMSKFLDDYTAKQAAIYAPALFGEDYASNPDIQTAITGYIALNKATLHNIIASSTDASPYERSLEFSYLVTSSGTSLSVNYLEKDNAGENNRVTDGVNGITGTLTVNYEVQNNTLVITSMHY